MMVARNLLHKDKLEDFKQWLTAKGREHRPSNAAWQVLQVKHGSGWMPIFSRAEMPEHLSVPGPLIPLVQAFIRESRLQEVVVAGKEIEERLRPPPGYTAEELERDNPHNAWLHESRPPWE